MTISQLTLLRKEKSSLAYFISDFTVTQTIMYTPLVSTLPKSIFDKTAARPGFSDVKTTLCHMIPLTPGDPRKLCFAHNPRILWLRTQTSEVTRRVHRVGLSLDCSLSGDQFHNEQDKYDFLRHFSSLWPHMESIISVLLSCCVLGAKHSRVGI